MSAIILSGSSENHRSSFIVRKSEHTDWRDSLAQAERDFDGVRQHGLVPVKALQRLHAFGLAAQPLIAIAKDRRDHFLAPRVFVTSFQRLVARALEVQY